MIALTTAFTAVGLPVDRTIGLLKVMRKETIACFPTGVSFVGRLRSGVPENLPTQTRASLVVTDIRNSLVQPMA